MVAEWPFQITPVPPRLAQQSSWVQREKYWMGNREAWVLVPALLIMLMLVNSLPSLGLGVLTFKLALVRGTGSSHFLYQ